MLSSQVALFVNSPLSFSDDIETVEVFLANNQILFRSEHISFYTRLLEGNYPDTDRGLIPTEFNAEATFTWPTLDLYGAYLHQTKRNG